MHPIQRLLVEMHQAVIRQVYDSIPDVVGPDETQNTIMQRIRQVANIAVVQDKGTAFALLGPKLKGTGGLFASRAKNPQFNIDVIVLNENANDPYWYSTLFHELAHATGTADRQNRIGITMTQHEYDPIRYAFEELVAESTARRIMERLGLATEVTRSRSAKYIETYATPMQYIIDTDKLQSDVDAAESMIMSWIETIDFKNTLKIA